MLNKMFVLKALILSPLTCMITISLIGTCFSEVTSTPADIEKNATKLNVALSVFAQTATSTEPLVPTEPASKNTISKKNESTSASTKAYVSTERATTARLSTGGKVTETKGEVKSGSWVKLTSSSTSRAPEARAHSAAGLEGRLGALDCDLALLPRQSRLWRGNETHELNLPVTASEDCLTNVEGLASTAAAGEDGCPPPTLSWASSVDIQSGDILIVRIADSKLRAGHLERQNQTVTSNNSQDDGARTHHSPPQPAVYQVTRQGHEHCDVSDGMLLDISPLDEQGDKLITLYDKDLTDGVNLLIVVSESWGPQCVRLKVTVKSDNCGEAQDCSAKGVCYTNVSMEGYECQCCPGYAGPHCEDKDACSPSPCLNNGICVELTQATNGVNYHCLCPDGYSGKRCEKDPCSSAPCLNAGVCRTVANGSARHHCACAAGWAGARCQLAVAAGACASSPCVHGICIDQSDNDIDGLEYRCFCQPGYTGEQCEVEYNECESSPCSNGGTCTDRVGGFSCACGRGYTGNTCQLKVDLCSPNPCPARRFCFDRGNSYSCECPRGYLGEECTVPSRSACDNNPCAHGGTCWNGEDSFYCSCRPGYTGKLCEEDFILESVVGGDPSAVDVESRSRGSVREVHLPLGLYHDRLHNVYIAAGTLGAAIAIVGVVVTACHCRVNKTYSRLLSRLSRVTENGPPHHWLQDKHAAPPLPNLFPPAATPAGTLDTTDMYYTLDFSDSQSSPLIQ